MIYSKELNENGFSNITEYFEYILELIELGRRADAKRFLSRLGKNQRLNCLNYFEIKINNGNILDELTLMILDFK